MEKTYTDSLQKKQTLSYNLLWIMLLGLVSQVYIPLWPVPITGQVLAFLLLGLYNTPKAAFQISLSYTVLGILGLPLFHHLTGGFAILFSPTLGYILGFPLISIIVALLKDKVNSFRSFCALSLLAIIPCYGLGLLFLSFVIGFNTALLISGFLIFIPGEMIKIAIAYLFFVRSR